MVAREFLDSDRVNFLIWRFVARPRRAPNLTAAALLAVFMPCTPAPGRRWPPYRTPRCVLAVFSDSIIGTYLKAVRGTRHHANRPLISS